MLDPEGLTFSPEAFSGIARLFPLPNLVLFPHILQALHVFEPRYRELLEDAMDSDRLIAMGVLTPGWQHDYDGRPPIFDVVCLGRVVSCKRVQEDRYNILLLGLRRARVIDELPPRRCFREAKVEVLEDVYPDDEAAGRPKLHRSLMDRFRRIVPKDPAAQGQIEHLLGNHIPLGVLTDLVAYSLHVGLEDKRKMLGEVNVNRRAEALLEHLDRLLTNRPTSLASRYPAEFSLN